MFILFIRIDVISTASSSLFSTVTSNHYATPPPPVAVRRREVISYPTRWRPRLGENGKCLISHCLWRFAGGGGGLANDWRRLCSFCVVMCVFTSSTLLLYLYKRHSDIEFKDLAKPFLKSRKVPQPRFKYLTHGSFELICTEVIFNQLTLAINSRSLSCEILTR